MAHMLFSEVSASVIVVMKHMYFVTCSQSIKAYPTISNNFVLFVCYTGMLRVIYMRLAKGNRAVIAQSYTTYFPEEHWHRNGHCCILWMSRQPPGRMQLVAMDLLRSVPIFEWTQIWGVLCWGFQGGREHRILRQRLLQSLSTPTPDPSLPLPRSVFLLPWKAILPSNGNTAGCYMPLSFWCRGPELVVLAPGCWKYALQWIADQIFPNCIGCFPVVLCRFIYDGLIARWSSLKWRVDLLLLQIFHLLWFSYLLALI